MYHVNVIIFAKKRRRWCTSRTFEALNGVSRRAESTRETTDLDDTEIMRSYANLSDDANFRSDPTFAHLQDYVR